MVANRFPPSPCARPQLSASHAPILTSPSHGGLPQSRYVPLYGLTALSIYDHPLATRTRPGDAPKSEGPKALAESRLSLRRPRLSPARSSRLFSFHTATGAARSLHTSATCRIVLPVALLSPPPNILRYATAKPAIQ